MGNQIERCFACSLTALGEGVRPFLTFGISHNVGAAFLDIDRNAHHIGVVRNHQPVEWSTELYW